MCWDTELLLFVRTISAVQTGPVGCWLTNNSIGQRRRRWRRGRGITGEKINLVTNHQPSPSSTFKSLVLLLLLLFLVMLLLSMFTIHAHKLLASKHTPKPDYVRLSLTLADWLAGWLADCCLLVRLAGVLCLQKNLLPCTPDCCGMLQRKVGKVERTFSVYFMYGVQRKSLGKGHFFVERCSNLSL